MCAPSAVNSRPWEFVVVENRALRQRMTEVHPYCRAATEASLVLAVCGIPQAWPDAPEGGMWPQDCAAAIENILLAATSLGYGTCWCGVYPHKGRVTALQELLLVTTVPVALILVGVADETPKQRGYYDPARVRTLR